VIRSDLLDQHRQHPRTKSSPGSRLATKRYAAVLDELGQLSDFGLFDRKVPLEHCYFMVSLGKSLGESIHLFLSSLAVFLS
jgi:hypothetical protein